MSEQHQPNLPAAVDITVYSTVSAMRAISSLVGRDYHRYTSGRVAVEKAEKLVRKFYDLYGTFEPRIAERRRRRRKEAITRIILCPHHRLDSGVLEWFLLVSDKGTGKVAEREKLLETRDSRYRLRLGDYELVKIPRPKMKPAWSWRVPPEDWRERVELARALAKHQSPELAQRLLAYESHRPGYRGIRLQQEQLYAAMARARNRRQPSLQFPPRYRVRFREHTGWRLSDLRR